MSVLENIRVFLAKRNLQKIVQVGEHRFLNLSKIKSLTILYYFNEPMHIDAKERYKEIYAMLENLRERGIKCELTFYVDDSLNETKRVNMTSVSKENFSKWTYSPDERTYTTFMMDDADALINLSPVTCWPLEYLAQYSHAPFKIAVQREEQGARYDFLFKPAEDTKFPLGVYEQIINYLEVINK